MTKETLLIFDDDNKNSRNYVARLNDKKEISKRFKIEPLTKKEFIDEMKILKTRQIGLRKGKDWNGSSSKIDNASVFIVDYDLVNIPDESSLLLTGEIVSYYVRCFSMCKLIIGMNQFPPNPPNNFDLTLKNHLESYADINIGSDQLDNPGLWGGKPKNFRPWHWPNIPIYLDNLHKKIHDLEDNMNKPICDFFGFSKEIVGILPRSIGEFLGEDPQTSTFESFLIDSGNGLFRKDNSIEKMDNEVKKLLIVSRISKWLEQRVLPGQNILIDAPHLVHRYPSLLKEKHTDIKNWNKTATFDDLEKLGLVHEKIEDFRFKPEYWLSHPAWLFTEIINCQRIKEVSDPWTRESSDYVFCEDTSSFHSTEKCKEFLAELDSPYIQRYVLCPDKSVIYTPSVRFSL